jgi:CO dehydrogenase nickel-insertion accessory protein CooC1
MECPSIRILREWLEKAKLNKIEWIVVDHEASKYGKVVFKRL